MFCNFTLLLLLLLLRPSNRALLEKLVKKFPAFHGTRRFIIVFTRSFSVCPCPEPHQLNSSRSSMGVGGCGSCSSSSISGGGGGGGGGGNICVSGLSFKISSYYPQSVLMGFV
jgi:uncharacterized membrane protein YgcG